VTGIEPGERGSAVPGGTQHTAFRVTTWAFLVFLYLFSPATSLLLGWFVDFDDNISHRVHEVTFGLMFTMILVGVAAQIRSPQRHIAGIQQALTAIVVFVAVVAASTGWEWTALIYIGPVVVIVILHPAREEVFRLRLRFDRQMVILMLLITLPMIMVFGDEFSKAVNEVRGHQAHWGGTAAFVLTMLVVGYMSSTRQPGWYVSGWTVAFAAIIFGAASAVFRFDASARPDLTAIMLIIWGVLVATNTERGRARERLGQEVAFKSDAVEGLRRGSRGRLVGGVARGFADHYNWNVWVVRGVLVILTVPTVLGELLPPFAPLAYLTAWWRVPLATARDPEQGTKRRRLPRWVTWPITRPISKASSRPPRPLVRRLMVGIGGAALLVTGAAGFTFSRELTPPPVPHDIESQSASTCVVCHATGAEHAPIINPFTHNFHSEFSETRSSLPFCGECHDLPQVSTASADSGRWNPPASWPIAAFTPLPPSSMSEIANLVARTASATTE